MGVNADGELSAMATPGPTPAVPRFAGCERKTSGGRPPCRGCGTVRERARGSGGGEPGHCCGHAVEGADGSQLTAPADLPAEDPARIGVDGVQEAAVAGDRLIAHALLPQPG